MVWSPSSPPHCSSPVLEDNTIYLYRLSKLAELNQATRLLQFVPEANSLAAKHFDHGVVCFFSTPLLIPCIGRKSECFKLAELIHVTKLACCVKGHYAINTYQAALMTSAIKPMQTLVSISPILWLLQILVTSRAALRQVRGQKSCKTCFKRIKQLQKLLQ